MGKKLYTRIKEGNEEVMYVKNPRDGKVVRTVFGAYERDFKPGPTATPTATPMPTAQPTAMPTAIPTPYVNALKKLSSGNPKTWEQLKKFFANQAVAKGYHPGAIVSQKAIESARGESEFAKKRFNYGGVGAYDSDPNQAFTFKGPKDYMNYYDKMIRKRFPAAYAVRHDPVKYATELKKGNYATDPDYVWKIQNTPEYREYKDYKLKKKN